MTSTVEADVMIALFEELGITDYALVQDHNDNEYAVETQAVRVGPKRKENMFLDPYGPISPLDN